MGKWYATNVGEIYAKNLYKKLNIQDSTKQGSPVVKSIQYNEKHKDYVITWSDQSTQTCWGSKTLLVWKEN